MAEQQLNIKFDVTVELNETYLQEHYEDYKPSLHQIIHDALEQIWTSHRFGTSMTAKNISINKYDSEGEGTWQKK